MKVSELTGEQLDYWVAKAIGCSVERANMGPGWIVATAGMGARVTGLPLNNPMHWSPSQDWVQGGPLIESMRISIWHRSPNDYASTSYWAASAGFERPEANAVRFLLVGTTPLEAAMRAVVALVYGEQVPDAPAVG
jgi:hypothetical protein